MVEPIVSENEEVEQEESSRESVEFVVPENVPESVPENMIEQNMMIQPFAFPTNNWGFNYQIDPGTFWISNFSDFSPKFRTLFMPIYNNFVDHVAGRINDMSGYIAENSRELTYLNARIDSTNSGQGNMQKQINGIAAPLNARIDSTNTYTYFLNDRIDSTNTGQGNMQKQINTLDSFLNARINSSNTDIGKLFTQYNYLNARIDSSNTSIGEAFVDIGFLNKRIDSSNTDIGKLFTQYNYLNARIDSANTSIGEAFVDIGFLNKRIDSSNTDIGKLFAKDTFLNSRIDSLNTDVGNAFTEFRKNNTDLVVKDTYLNSRIDSSNTSVGNAFAELRKNNIDLTAKDVYLNARIDSSNSEHVTLESKILSNYSDITALTAKVNSLDFLDDLSVFFSATSTAYENGIVSTDGIFTKLIKGQFTRLIAELNRQLTLSFTTTTNNIDSFKTYLREEFALLNDWASLQVDWSTMINENILLAIAALDKLIAKPNGAVNVNVPSFDYDRLKDLLDELSFGNVVNEAGTNLWDVLQQLIESLGGVVDSVLSIVPDLIDRLIELIIPENPNFFTEDIKVLTDSFDSKFEWTSSLSDSFQSIYSQPKSLKTLNIQIAGKSYKVVPDFVDLNLIKTILTGYFCFLTLFTSYKRVVGGGDVIQ